MAGHSKWANIKHRKEGMDKKRGKLFAKISREIMIAAKLGGSDPANNPKLRIAISKARAANIPSENIERAIKKSAGELEGQNYEEVMYEAFAPGGVGILIEVLTNKKARTTPEIKNILAKGDASMSSPNSVIKFFERKGQILISKEHISEDKLLEIAIDNGAEDVVVEDTHFEILCDPKDFSTIVENIQKHQIPIEESGIRFIPTEGTEITVDQEKVQKILKLIESLEEHDDVQAVYHNMLFSDELAKTLS